MDTKQYLGQISRLNRMIGNKLMEIAQLKELSKSISAINSEERVQTTPNPDRIGASIAKIDEMEREIDSLIDQYVDTKEKIISQIDNLENEVHYEVLFARYIEKKTFEKIASEMCYSFRQIVRVHGNALKDFEKKYGKEYLEK